MEMRSVVQKLIPAHPAGYITFCHWMLQSVPDGTVDVTLLFLSDAKAWFELSGFVNAQNTCHWDILSNVEQKREGMLIIYSRIKQQSTHQITLWKSFVKFLVKG
jgi:hypothetical protein